MASSTLDPELQPQDRSLREKCPNMELFQVWIQENTDQK